MPHDKNGEEIKAGDLVTLKCRVTLVNTNSDYCNAQLETVERMSPGHHTTSISVNTSQVEKWYPPPPKR